VGTTSTTTQGTTGGADPRGSADVIAASARGHIGRVVAGSLIGGLAAAVFVVAVPFAAGTETVITGSVLLTFAAAWFALAMLSQRWTDQPQRWAFVPAAFMAIAGAVILAVAPTGNELGWVWPPVVMTLVVWMVVRARQPARKNVLVPSPEV
jgi:peptidoglycan/LPS O-acetylase OafA/YrhL